MIGPLYRPEGGSTCDRECLSVAAAAFCVGLQREAPHASTEKPYSGGLRCECCCAATFGRQGAILRAAVFAVSADLAVLHCRRCSRYRGDDRYCAVPRRAVLLLRIRATCIRGSGSRLLRRRLRLRLIERSRCESAQPARTRAHHIRILRPSMSLTATRGVRRRPSARLARRGAGVAQHVSPIGARGALMRS
jgi:hypothetical protein